MTRYSIQPRCASFLRATDFFSFAKNMGKNGSKYISKNLSRKYSQKPFHHAKQSAKDALKTALLKKQKKRFQIFHKKL